MDNPNVSIADLFAGVKESLDKYQKKQKYYRPPKRSQPTSTADDADGKPILFRSLLKPANVESEDHSKKITSVDTQSNDASDALKTKLSPSESQVVVSTNLNSNLASSIPDCVPLDEGSEMRRREAVSAALRASMKKITASNKSTPKPLSWNQPSFHFTSNSDDAPKVDTTTKRDQESSRATQTGKRKECNSTACDIPAPSTNYRGLETIMPRQVGADPPPLSSSWREEGITTGSYSSSIYGSRHFQPNRKKWSKEEVDGLLELVSKWITPDMKRKKT